MISRTLIFVKDSGTLLSNYRSLYF